MKINTVIFTNDSTESTASHFLDFRHISYKEDKTVTKNITRKKKITRKHKCYSQLPVQSPLCCFESPLYTPTKVKSLGNIIWQFKMMLPESRIDFIYASAVKYLPQVSWQSAFFAVLLMIDLVGFRSSFGR